MAQDTLLLQPLQHLHLDSQEVLEVAVALNQVPRVVVQLNLLNQETLAHTDLVLVEEKVVMVKVAAEAAEALVLQEPLDKVVVEQV